jgi:hypothetical protein
MILSIEQNGCLPLYRCKRCLIHRTWTPSSVCWWPSISSYLTCNSYNHIDDMIILYNDILITTHHNRIVPHCTACLDPPRHATPDPAKRVRCMWHTGLHFSTWQKEYINFTLEVKFSSTSNVGLNSLNSLTFIMGCRILSVPNGLSHLNPTNTTKIFQGT